MRLGATGSWLAFSGTESVSAIHFLTILRSFSTKKATYLKSFHLKFMKGHTSANELGALKNSFLFKDQNAFESFEKRSPGLFSSRFIT